MITEKRKWSKIEYISYFIIIFGLFQIILLMELILAIGMVQTYFSELVLIAIQTKTYELSTLLTCIFLELLLDCSIYFVFQLEDNL